MVTIIDYGVGNIQSLKNAFNYIGQNVKITNNKSTIENSSHIILPGVGSFNYAIEKLKQLDIYETLKNLDKDKKLLCICLGMQLLFDGSMESKNTKGLGLIEGKVLNLNEVKKNEVVPNIGWKKLQKSLHTDIKNNKFINLLDNKYFYHLHSFYCSPKNKSIICNEITFGDKLIPVSVKTNNIYAVQFHPEKSRKQGLTILDFFINN